MSWLLTRRTFAPNPITVALQPAAPMLAYPVPHHTKLLVGSEQGSQSAKV